MRYSAILVITLLAAALVVNAGAAEPAGPQVVLETSKGDIVLALSADKAPVTVDNFLSYVKSGFFDGTTFHRVIPKFMIQGGGFTPDMTQKPTAAAIINEADNGLKNDRGTIAMARTSEPASATSQFFINTVDNGFLNHKGKTLRGWGYAVFGRVVKGMEVVDAISGVKTANRGPFGDVPVEPVIILKAKVVE